MYVNISKKCQYFDKCMSIFQKNVNISINLCQDFKKCQYFDKLMSIFRQIDALSRHGGSPGSLVFTPMLPDQDPGYIYIYIYTIIYIYIYMYVYVYI